MGNWYVSKEMHVQNNFSRIISTFPFVNFCKNVFLWLTWGKKIVKIIFQSQNATYVFYNNYRLFYTKIPSKVLLNLE